MIEGGERTTQRAAEVRSGDLVARLGGDEFGVVLPGAGTSAAYLVADRMAKVISALADEAVTVSIGVANGPASAVLDTLHAADSAMYVAKRAGGNQAHLHEPRPEPGPKAVMTAGLG